MTATQFPLFYRNVAPLNRERHKDWYIDTDQGYSFARETNSVYVAGGEFPHATRDYPVVFARDGKGMLLPVALLGLRQQQNLMVDPRGAWIGDYVPAYIRRYPFILAAADAAAQNFTVCVDESYSGFNTVQEGERLLTAEGQHGQLLAKSVKFLQEFHTHTQITTAFCQALDEAGVLESMQANIAMTSGEQIALAGFWCVSRDKLKGLAAEVLKQFAQLDYLDLVYLHIHSLVNVQKLVQRLGAVAGAADETPCGLMRK